MKIGLIAYGLDRPLTGMGRYTVELARALQRLDDPPEIHILTDGSTGPLRGEGFRNALLPGCRKLFALMTIGNLWVSLQARRLNLDVLHDPCGVAPFLFNAGNAGIVVTLHDVIPYVYPQTSSLLERIIYYRWLPLRLPSVQAVLTGSHHSRKDIQRYLSVRGDRLFVVPYGISDRFRASPGEGAQTEVANKYGIARPYVLYVGDFTHRKNLKRLLEAFLSMRSRRGDIRLVLAGSRMNQRVSIDPTIRRLRMENCVHVIGPIAETDLPALYAGAELFVFPSLYEGFGFPPLEAMASGIPVISSYTTSLPEVVGEAVVPVNPYKVDALAEAMRNAIVDPVLRKELREKGFRQSGRYSWDRTARETMAVYRFARESKIHG
jgi:glycosyltransferase involved in cell wall biosynthesis